MSRRRRRPVRWDLIDTWLFDLDNTLYHHRHNLFDQVERRIRAFVAAHLGVDPAAAHVVQKSYYRDHGSTMRGMMIRHGVDPKAFLEFVHDIDVTVVPPDQALDAALGRLPGRKLIFTNGSVAHAENVMRRLGVQHHFAAVFDIVAADYVPKPDPVTYARLLRSHAIEPSRTVFVDDILRNLAPAADLGMATVWVRTGAPWALVAGETPEFVHEETEGLTPWLGEVATELAAPPG
ncbi:MAG: pyrimidine 5'-nucleotidase [Alphaproteobacteria bacterium]|nr:pyrimidine 5'-nucleotidase [Alphaproteobacteria bacterium]